MNKSELEKKLIKKLVSSESFSLNGGLPNERYCLDKDGDLWITYYSERGLKSNLIEFDNESDACEYFLKNILKDKTTLSNK